MEDKINLESQHSKLNSTIEVQQVKAKKLEAASRKLGAEALAATEVLRTVFSDLDKLPGEKGELYRLVVETAMDERAKQEFHERLGQHLDSIRATGIHLDEVRKVLRRMKAASG